MNIQKKAIYFIYLLFSVQLWKILNSVCEMPDYFPSLTRSEHILLYLSINSPSAPPHCYSRKILFFFLLFVDAVAKLLFCGDVPLSSARVILSVERRPKAPVT